MSLLTKDNEGFFSIYFRLLDDQNGASTLQTNTFASIEIKITEVILVEEVVEE